jgi:hypothetical protein
MNNRGQGVSMQGDLYDRRAPPPRAREGTIMLNLRGKIYLTDFCSSLLAQKGAFFGMLGSLLGLFPAGNALCALALTIRG